MESSDIVKLSVNFRGAAIFVVMFIIPLQYIFNKALNEYGAQLIISFQSARNDSLDKFLKGFFYFENNILLLVIFPAVFNLYESKKAIKFIFINCTGMYFCSVVALVSKEPRPYWPDSSIVGINCQNGYACPFLELFITTILCIYYCVKLFDAEKVKYKVLAYTLTFVLSSLIAVAGMYLGLSYPHQIFITYCCLYVYLISVLAFDEDISTLIKSSCFNYKMNRKYQIHWFLATLFFLAIIIGIDTVINVGTQMDIKWIQNSYTNCKHNNDIGPGPSFQASGWIFYNLGIVYGCMLSSEIPLNWWNSEYWKRLLRVLISSSVSLGVFLLFGNL
jgi:hypothetical protein